MKKIIALLLGVIMIFSAFGACAKGADFLRTPYTNYSADYNVTVKPGNLDDLYAFIDESIADDEGHNYINFKEFIKSILNSQNSVNVQCAVSDDYQKIDVAVTSEGNKKFEVNSNLSADVTYSAGMWLHADFSTETPEFIIAYQTPMHNKYEVIDVMKQLSADEAEEISTTIKAIFTPELLNNLTNMGADALEKYADITHSGNRHTIHLDNAAFVAMIDELFTSVANEFVNTSENLPEDVKEIVGEISAEDIDIPVLDNLKIFGDKGITFVYELTPQGNISSCKLSADVEFALADVYTAMFDEEWEYSCSGVIDMDVSIDMDVYNIGKTKPVFPTLTEENSFESRMFRIDVLGNEYEYFDYNGFQPFVYGEMDESVEKDGLLYFPMEELLGECYRDSLNIEKGSTAVTITSDYLKDISYATVSVGSDLAYTDVAEYNIGEVIEKDGVIYVSEKFFTDVLGWNFETYRENYTDGTLEYSFYVNVVDKFLIEESMNYPYNYVWAVYDGLHVNDNVWYVPLRKVMEEAYDDQASITYTNGTITMESKWFADFSSVTMAVGSDKAVADGVSYDIGEVIIEDSSVYVPVALFKDVFGWELVQYAYDKIGNDTRVEFGTN